MKIGRLANALGNLAEGQAALPVEVEAGRCVHRTNHESECRVCVESCPASAISLTEQTIAVEANACVRCGYCLHCCPTGVFSAPTAAADQNRLLAFAANHRGQSLEVVCGPHPAAGATSPSVDTVLRTGGCLAALGASAYVGLAAQGIKSLQIRLDACADCPLGAAQPLIEAVFVAAAGFSQIPHRVAGEGSMQVARRPVESTTAPLYSRRDLFRRAAVPPSLPPPVPSGIRQPPLERRSLLKALGQMPPSERVDISSFPFLEATSDCSACGLCTVICPTGALHLERAEGQFDLRFSPQTCTGCRLCVELCGPAALLPATSVPFSQSDPRSLRVGALKTCERCRVEFAGAGDLCPTCAFRRQHPFGSRPRPNAPDHSPEHH